MGLNTVSAESQKLNSLIPTLLDQQARDLAQNVEWWDILEPGHLHRTATYPVAHLGEGEPILLLHGFDSSFLEFRRIAPLLSPQKKLLIPDLHGFGFSPRPSDGVYTPEAVLQHLEALLNKLPREPVGVIGASMGGSVAVELARRYPKRIHRLLLLAPAGLTGRPVPLPPVLNHLGVWFLSQPSVRRGLCRQAFANPDVSVGIPEEQLASLHLGITGWAASLAAFARTGGFAGCGIPLPKQRLHVIWGCQDRILRLPQKQAVMNLLGDVIEELNPCGHLPHLDQPEAVARCWLEGADS